MTFGNRQPIFFLNSVPGCINKKSRLQLLFGTSRFHRNFGGHALGGIDADVCNPIFSLQYVSRCTTFAQFLIFSLTRSTFAHFSLCFWLVLSGFVPLRIPTFALPTFAPFQSQHFQIFALLMVWKCSVTSPDVRNILLIFAEIRY